MSSNVSDSKQPNDGNGPEADATSATGGSEEARRGFLTKLVGLGLAAAAYAVPVVAALAAALNPLRLKGASGSLLRLTSLESLPADGIPRKFPVIAERTDAWTRSMQAIGAVYLRRTGPDQIEALQVVCPHAGCTVEFKEAAEAAADDGGPASRFVCPCHKAMFDVTGKRIEEDSQAPRDMDALEVEIRNDTEIWVRFENYKVGTPDRTTLS
jgi:menaquinol-cytochrome c reductase iron-sulfur subunit